MTPEQQLERVAHFLLKLERRISKPFEIIDEQRVRGFRYGAPTITHYVVINLANSVATINAAIILFRAGFQSQGCMLLRTIMEGTSKLSYVLAGIDDGKIDRKSEAFLHDFFADNERPTEKRKPYRGISQKDLHRRTSERVTKDLNDLHQIGLQSGKNNENEKYAKLQSEMYADFSNHIHGRYPELMNIYGEFSRDLKFNGNAESLDVDAAYHELFLLEIAKSLEKRLKLAFMLLHSSGQIQMSADERVFCFEGQLE